MDKFVINSEKLSTLSSFSKQLPEYASNIWKNLLNEFDFYGENKNGISSNKIKQYAYLNLPSIKSIEYIMDLLECDTKQYIDDYLREETNIKNCLEPSDIFEFDDEIEEEIDEEKKKLINEFFMKDK